MARSKYLYDNAVGGRMAKPWGASLTWMSLSRQSPGSPPTLRQDACASLASDRLMLYARPRPLVGRYGGPFGATFLLSIVHRHVHHGSLSQKVSEVVVTRESKDLKKIPPPVCNNQGTQDMSKQTPPRLTTMAYKP